LSPLLGTWFAPKHTPNSYTPTFPPTSYLESVLYPLEAIFNFSNLLWPLPVLPPRFPCTSPSLFRYSHVRIRSTKLRDTPFLFSFLERHFGCSFHPAHSPSLLTSTPYLFTFSHFPHRMFSNTTLFLSAIFFAHANSL